MAEQEQNRSEPATPFKLAEARKQGQVARSLDFNSFVLVFALLLILLTLGGSIAMKVMGLGAWLLQQSGALRLESVADTGWFAELIWAFLGIVVPFAVVGIAFAVIANVLQTGPVLTFVPLKPRFERINPIAGFKRVFNKRMLFEAFKTVLKLGFFSAILLGFFETLWPAFPAAAKADSGVQVGFLASSVKALLFRLGLALLIVGVLDLVYTRWQYGKQMMMSRREMKEEVKRREGDPHVRARIRELQRENLKQARSLGRVPEADVLITNPDHISIALRYVRGEMSAPHVVAKGADAWAAEMKAVARRHGIPVLERRSLARQLFRSSQLDRPVPPETFLDVARVYAEVGFGREAAPARHEVRS
jgi:flagellar biosynthetic protein FlhB